MTAKLDPAHVDIVSQPRRRRRANVPANMAPMLADAEKRARRRPAAPGMMIEVEPRDSERRSYSSPYVDRNAWELMLADAFGTRSFAVIQTFTDQIAELCRKQWDEGSKSWLRDEGELNLCLNLINSLKPRNEAEAALAILMCGVYLMQIRVAGRSLSGGIVYPDDAAVASKLARTYGQLFDSLNRARGKGSTSRQKITVRYEKHDHKHVHFEGGGPDDFRRQSHASRQGDAARRRNGSNGPDHEGGADGTAIEAPGLAALPGPDAIGGDVPGCGCEGQARLPDARGSKGRGRSEGRV